MPNTDIDIDFTPRQLRAFSRNEAHMTINVKNLSANTYWCECEIMLMPPLSLANDSEMNSGRMRVGIIKPMGKMSKQVKVYTRPNNYPDDYKFSIVAFVYDEDGAIAERVEKKASIACASEVPAPKQG